MSGLESGSTSLSHTDSTGTSDDMRTTKKDGNAQRNTELPETGEDGTSQNGLMAGVVALLAGLGLMKKKKKDKNEGNDKA
ncbi:LPXTG cell wall anchor domain-containing protein [Staphylococcus intermedius]